MLTITFEFAISILQAITLLAGFIAVIVLVAPPRGKR